MAEEIVKEELVDTTRRGRRWLRVLLLLLGPVLLLAIGGYVYYTGGRYVATENAYVKADIAVISAEVPGRSSESTFTRTSVWRPATCSSS